MALNNRNFGRTKAIVAFLLVLLLAVGLFASCRDQQEPGSEQLEESGISSDLAAIAEARGLTPDDVSAALKTYTPSGTHDEYILFASGGHAGQVYAIGVPSMRILKQIAVFTPEPWQGYGYGAKGSMEVLAGGYVNEDLPLTWGDTHHPALSETGGEYDGDWLFINDKANARVAVIDLRDFETKQIVKNPISLSRSWRNLFHARHRVGYRRWAVCGAFWVGATAQSRTIETITAA